MARAAPIKIAGARSRPNQKVADRRQGGAADEHLGETKPERQPAHAHKALPRQLQADHEQ